MVKEVTDKKIILIGELNNEPKHHDYQLRLIKALYEKGISIAIGLEMFRANDQAILNKWVAGDLTLDQFLPIYSANWRDPWSLYEDIFLFSKQKKIPLIGLNVPPEIPGKIARMGFVSLSEEEIRQLPPGIRCDVDETYIGYIKRVYSGRSSGKEFVNFCEAQMVWDNAMALYTLKYLEKYPNSTVVVLSAWDHAWKRATPRQIERLDRRYTVSVILPELIKTERDIMTAEDADFLILNKSPRHPSFLLPGVRPFLSLQSGSSQRRIACPEALNRSGTGLAGERENHSVVARGLSRASQPPSNGVGKANSCCSRMTRRWLVLSMVLPSVSSQVVACENASAR
jgi:uncharacterized iron-regulated protein